MSTEPIRGRVLRPDEELPDRLQRPYFTSAPGPDPTPEPEPAPATVAPAAAPAPAEEPVPAAPVYEAPPDIVHVHVTITPGTDVSPIEAETRPWWRPAWTLRTAIVSAIGLMPIPTIGAPAGQWALQLSDIAGEQSMGAAWVIGGAAVAGALANDRRVARSNDDRWDPEERAWRPGWLARAILCAAVAGACLTLPLLDAVVYLLTGVRP